MVQIIFEKMYNAATHRAGGLTEWFNREDDDVIHFSVAIQRISGNPPSSGENIHIFIICEFKKSLF